MSKWSQTSRRFAVIGGGISGLVAAYRLGKLLPDSRVELFEASTKLGGVLSTVRVNGFLLERGADSFVSRFPWAIALCEELGLGRELIPTNNSNRRALVLKGNKIYPIPSGFTLIRPQRLLPIVGTPALSWRGKCRLIAERWRPVCKEILEPQFDDNVAHFSADRLGREAFERLVEPMVAGIYTADATRLSVAATMPDAIEVLRRYGTLWHRRQSEVDVSGGARYGSFVTLRNGMGQLIDRLSDLIPKDNVHLGNRVVALVRHSPARWLLCDENGTMAGPFAGVAVAVPAPHAARLLGDVDPELSELLRQIVYASSAVVSVAFKRESVRNPLHGFGIVVPRVENRELLAASFSSVKFPGRAPNDSVMIRSFWGGALRPSLVDLSDDELTTKAVKELNSILSIRGKPTLVDVARWRDRMPQYHVGHCQLVRRIETLVGALPGLELAGNAYHGVGIPHCVQSGETAAHKLANETSAMGFS